MLLTPWNSWSVGYHERLELLNEAIVINWDEFFNVAVDHWEAGATLLTSNWKIIWIFYGDLRQILPIVPNDAVVDILIACVQASALWSKVEVFYLVKNMRLETMVHRHDLTPSEIADIAGRNKYSLVLGAIGEGLPNPVPLLWIRL